MHQCPVIVQANEIDLGLPHAVECFAKRGQAVLLEGVRPPRAGDPAPAWWNRIGFDERDGLEPHLAVGAKAVDGSHLRLHRPFAWKGEPCFALHPTVRQAMELDDLLRVPLGRNLEQKVLNGIQAFVLLKPNTEPIGLSADEAGLGRHTSDAVAITAAGHVQIALALFVHDADHGGQGGARRLGNPAPGQPIDERPLKSSVANKVVLLWKGEDSIHRHKANQGGE